MAELKTFLGQNGFKTSHNIVVDDEEEEEEEKEEEKKKNEEIEEVAEEAPVSSKKEKEKAGKLKEQLKKLIDNPDLDEDALEEAAGQEGTADQSDVATKAKTIFISPQTAWWELSNTEKSERKPREVALEKQQKRAEDLMARQVAAFDKSTCPRSIFPPHIHTLSLTPFFWQRGRSRNRRLNGLTRC